MVRILIISIKGICAVTKKNLYFCFFRKIFTQFKENLNYKFVDLIFYSFIFSFTTYVSLCKSTNTGVSISQSA